MTAELRNPANSGWPCRIFNSFGDLGPFCGIQLFLPFRTCGGNRSFEFLWGAIGFDVLGSPIFRFLERNSTSQKAHVRSKTWSLILYSFSSEFDESENGFNFNQYGISQRSY